MNKFLFFLVFNFSIAFAQKDFSNEQKYIPDVSISRINLLDTSGIEKYLGGQVMNKVNNNLFASASFSNSNFNQVLEIFYHPGSNNNEFSEFRVYYSDGRKETILNEKEFVTESGICLGISKNNIVKIKGLPNNIRKEKSVEIFEYFVKDYGSSLFLKKYNLPEYQSKYYFKDDILIRFHFGFIYP